MSRYYELRHLVEDYIPLGLGYVSMLDALAPDRAWAHYLGGEHVNALGLERAPAAVRNHHAYEGGLVVHMLEMWYFWVDIRTQFEKYADVGKESPISDSRVLRAIIHHDLHKAYFTYAAESTDPWQVRFISEHPTNCQMTNDQKSMWILNQHSVKIDQYLANALFMAEGGWTREKPRCYGALSVILTSIDALSGSALEKVRMGQFYDEGSIEKGHTGTTQNKG